MAKTPAWQRSEGKNPSGGLNEKGRASLRAAGHDIKRPQPEGGSRKDSFCARMKGMKDKLTSSETANDPDSRINKSLRKWKCADGGALEVARKYKDAGGRIYRQNKSPWQRESETTPRSMSPMTQKYPGSDITPEISKDQYKKGKLGKDDYALSKGGAASYRKPRASGGKAKGYVIPQFNSDAEALAAMMWSEADIFRGRPDQQEAIVGTGWSAKNRALAGFPEGMPANYRNTHDVHSIKDQITNPGGSGYGAYSYFNKTRANMAQKAFGKDPAVRDYYLELANNIINGTIEDPTQGAMSYYNPQATKGTPDWAAKKGKELGWYETVKDEKGKGGSHVYFGNNDYTPKALAAQKQEADALAQRATPRSKAGDFTPKNPPPVQTPDEKSQNAFFQKYLYGTDAEPPTEIEGDVDFDTSLLNRMYNELYGRKATEAEVAYLKDRLDKGEFDMGDLFTYMSKTPEAKQYGDTQLDKLYQESYGRKASDAEKAYLNKAFADGTLSREDLAAYLPTTAEAKTYGNAQLDKIYNESFGRKITDQEREYINQAIANKQLTREDLASYLPTTSEGKSWTATQEAQKKADADYQKALVKYNDDVAAYKWAKYMYDLYGNPAVKFMAVPVAPTKPGQYVSGFNPAVQYGWNNQNQNQNLGQQLVGIGAGGNVGAGSTGAVGGATSPTYTGTTPGYSGGSAPPGYTYTPVSAQDLMSAGQNASYYPPSNTYSGGTGSLPIGTGTGIATKAFEPILPSSSYQYNGPDISGGMPTYLSGLPTWQGPSQSASILPSGNGNPYSPGSSTYYGTGGTGGYTGSGGLGIITIERNRGGRTGKAKGGALSDAMSVARCYKKGGPVWDKPRPKSLGKPKHLSSSQKSSAKAMAKAAGRPYPNLVDNMRAAKKG